VAQHHLGDLALATHISRDQNAVQLRIDAMVLKQGVGKEMFLVPAELDSDRIAPFKQEANLRIIAAGGEEPRPALTVRGMKMFN